MSRDPGEQLVEVNAKLAQVIGFIIDLLEIAGERLDTLERVISSQQTFEDWVGGAPHVGLTEDQRERLKVIMDRISAGVDELSQDDG